MVFEMKNIVKNYGSLCANDHVSIHLNKGEILAIIGENGAGKSTITKILYGLEKPDEGEIFVDGKQVRFRSPTDAMAVGIGMVQQHFMLFESMSIAENIVFKNEITKGPFLDRKKTIKTVTALSKQYGLEIDPEAKIEDCSVGIRQRVEILKILYQNANIIIFDEPSAVLTPLEVEALLETMKQLAKMGKSIVLITHKLHEVISAADRIYVMRRGHVVAERIKSETNSDELAYLMVGKQMELRQIKPQPAGRQLLQVRSLSLMSGGRDVLRDVNLQVSAGEIVGIAGVSGNGQVELIQCLTGLLKPGSGTVLLQGTDVTHSSVCQRRAAGMAYVPEDRYLWGSAPSGTLSENTLMGKESKEPFCKNGFLKKKTVEEYCQTLISKYDVRALSPRQRMSEMSGGNAQKLIVAREMQMDAPLMISCEPTRGVDIGAMLFIHDQMLRMRSEGSGILLVSSELSEIMTLSDRIYVMFEGRICGEFQRGSIDERALGVLMLGGKKADG